MSHHHDDPIRKAILNDISCVKSWKIGLKSPYALASVLQCTTEFAQAILYVLNRLSDDELERIPTPTIAARIIAEHDRILKAAVG